MLLNSLVLPNGIWQMQLFQINQSEDSSKITIMYDNPSRQLHQRSITTAPTLIFEAPPTGQPKNYAMEKGGYLG